MRIPFRLQIADGVSRPSRDDTAALRLLANRTMAAYPPPGPVDLVLVDDGAIQELNQRFRGIDRSTDVLSFDLRGDDDEVSLPGVPAGEIYISIDRAREQAAALGVPLLEELGRLMVHGFLHLAGRDHPTPAELAMMEADTEQLLVAAGLSTSEASPLP